MARVTKLSGNLPVDAYWRKRQVWTRTDYPGTIFQSATGGTFAVSNQFGNVANTTSDPNWQVLVQRRLDASGSYYRRRYTFEPVVTKLTGNYYHPGIRAWFDDKIDFTYMADPTYPTMLVQEQDDSSLKDLALARLKRKLSSRSNQVNVLVPIVELRELRGLVTALTFATTDLFYALLKIKKSKGKSAAQFAAHAWLNYSFALAPTLSDIKSIAEAIDVYIKQSGGNSFTDYGAAKKIWNTASPTTQTSTVQYGNSDVRCFLRHQLSYRYVAGYTTPLRSANNYDGAKDFGLEIGALVPTLWESTAFSWLADYLTTMGAFLDDTFITDNINTFYVNCTKRYTCTGRWQISKGFNAMSGTFTSTVNASGFTCDVTERTVLSQLPARSLRFKTSDEISKNALNKLANLGGILVGGRALSNKY